MKLTLPEVIQRLMDLQAGAWPNQPTNVVDVHAGAMGVEVTTEECEDILSLRSELRDAEREADKASAEADRFERKAESLQRDLVRAEDDIASKDREIAALEDQIERLRAERT